MPKLSQLVPYFARATLRAVSPSLADRRMGPALAKYESADLIERLIVPVTNEDPDTEAAIEISDACDALITKHDWLGLAEYLTEFDQSRAAIPSGKRLLEVVLQYLRDSLSNLNEAPNEVNYETTYVYSNRLLDAVEAAHLLAPKNYMLAAILARLRLDCAWSARQSNPMDELDGPTRSVLRDHAQMVHKLITKFDPIAYNSPFLAEIQYDYVALMDPELDRLVCAFDDWIELDLANLTAYRHHAFFLNNLFSKTDDRLLEAEARRAVELGEDVIGKAGYTIMYLHVLKFDASAFALLDEDTFTQGFDDLMIALGKDPLRLIYMLEHIIERLPDENHAHRANLPRAARVKAARIRKALTPIIRKYIGSLYVVAWDLEEIDFLHAVAPSFSEELDRGATVEITEGRELITENGFVS